MVTSQPVLSSKHALLACPPSLPAIIGYITAIPSSRHALLAYPLSLSATVGYIVGGQSLALSTHCWPALLPSLPQLVTSQPVPSSKHVLLAGPPSLSATVGYITASPQLQACTAGRPSFPLCHSWLHHSQSPAPSMYCWPALLSSMLHCYVQTQKQQLLASSPSVHRSKLTCICRS